MSSSPNISLFYPHETAPDFVRKAHVSSMSEYQELYKKSIDNPTGFWREKAQEFLTWDKPFDKVQDNNFANAEISWFTNGKINLCYNAIDRHLGTTRENKPAIIWEGDDPSQFQTFSYKQLHQEVSLLANVLKANGVKKGDIVTIYMPMVPQLAFAVLACARLGAIHSVIFGGFSPQAICDRIIDCTSSFIITVNYGRRGGKLIDMKANVDIALEKLQERQIGLIKSVIVFQVVTNKVSMKEGRDFWYHEQARLKEMKKECKPEPMDSEDPLFILYTSGSTGKPKGVLHTTAGYGLYTAMTHKYIFDLKEDDIYWCTADVGWVTGHSYVVYGPLINGGTSVMFEGVPSYPNYSRFWEIIDKHKITIFYTAPTAIRALMKHGDEPVRKTSRRTLRILGTVGEPINPEVWLWYFNIVGNKKCPIVDTWWQTETGGFMLTPFPYATPQKPGSATLPFFGIQPCLLDDDNNEIIGEGSGHLCVKAAWPSIMRTVYGDAQRFFDTYFKEHQGYYFSGDNCRRDKDGYYWIMGRADDVINVSGHRLGTAEVESAILENKSVAEAAVVGYPHEIKGQGIYAYITLKINIKESDALKAEIIDTVAGFLSPIAKPDIIHWAPVLPKTRSGKIMRRILRKIAQGEKKDFGDISTLADPSVVEKILNSKS